MAKRFIISEEEKNDIKSLYNITEQSISMTGLLFDLLKKGMSDEEEDSDDIFDTDKSKDSDKSKDFEEYSKDSKKSEEKIPKTTTSDDEFFKKILRCLGAEPTKSNMLFMYAWRQAEGGKAKNNPFNTTMKMPGATNIINTSVGVKNYLTPEDGIYATCNTLKNGRNKYGYDKIIDGLKNDIGLVNLSDAVIKSKWGTEGILIKVVKGYIAGNSPKPKPINKTEIA